MSRLTDAELSRAVQNRDEAAMETIINRYSRLLWRICAAVLSKSGGSQDIEECVADVFVYLWRHPERYDPARSTLKTFLCMVARSRATDRRPAICRCRCRNDNGVAFDGGKGENFDLDRKEFDSLDKPLAQ